MKKTKSKVIAKPTLVKFNTKEGKELFFKAVKTTQKVIHRHKWERDFADCPFCGAGEYYLCECGEIRVEKYIGKGKFKLAKP